MCVYIYKYIDTHINIFIYMFFWFQIWCEFLFYFVSFKYIGYRSVTMEGNNSPPQ
jgi:hypothetical protein